MIRIACDIRFKQIKTNKNGKTFSYGEWQCKTTKKLQQNGIKIHLFDTIHKKEIQSWYRAMSCRY